MVQCGAVCCSVVQCVAVCCMLQCVRCSVSLSSLLGTNVTHERDSVLALLRSGRTALQRAPFVCDRLCCSVLQCVCCSVL